MSEWKEVSIGEINTKLGDGLHGTPKYSEDGDCFFVNGNNLRDGEIVIDENTRRVSVEEFHKYKKELNKRTLLVSINGTLGNVAYYNGENIILGKSACYFNIKPEVTMSRQIAVDLYKEIINIRPHWHSDDLDKGVLKVVMTASSSDGPKMMKHHTFKEQRRTLADRMRDNADPMKLVIVRDMWLTGFDAPSLQCFKFGRWKESVYP